MSLTQRQSSSGIRIRPGHRAFTLVELLVVIGIIALLMSILLPALNRARAQANAVKCASAMREIGNAFRYYANDNHNYYPPAQLQTATGVKYNIDGVDFPVDTRYGAYWFNFINRYVTKNLGGQAAKSAAEASDFEKRSVIWGCPVYQAYTSTNANDFGVNRSQVGYGMNAFPYFSEDSANASFTQAQRAFVYTSDSPIAGWSPANPGVGFLKATVWGRRGAARALIAEAKYWLATAAAPSVNARGTDTTVVGPQEGDAAGNAATDPTSVSFWRHGKLPANQASGGGYPQYSPYKGRVLFNILYCDGHVSTVSDPKEGFRSLRMKFPG